MAIKRVGLSGTMESSDIMITLEPNNAQILDIELDSTVGKQFGREIRRVIIETLIEMGIEGAKITAVDKGALDCTIRARVRTAVLRATDDKKYPFGGVSK